MTGDSASHVIEKSKSDTQEACEVTEKADHVPATEDHDERRWGVVGRIDSSGENTIVEMGKTTKDLL